MRLKAGVQLDGLVWQMVYALALTDYLLTEAGHELTVTAGTDGTHNPGSLHPKGRAVDIRTRDLPDAVREKLFAELKARLDGKGYDIVWEGGVGATPATTGAHIHIEYDPKAGDVTITL